jgi:hypothetical protein
VKWGKGKGGDTTQRSVIKAVAWRLFAALNTLVVSAFFAKNVRTGQSQDFYRRGGGPL